MSIFSTFGTDKKAELEGKWIKFPANDDGTIPAFCLAYMGKANPAYQKAMEKIAKQYKREAELDALTEAVAGPVLQDLFIHTILKGWENVQDPNGEVIEYSKETASQLFDELPHLYEYLVSKAREIATFRNFELDAISGE